MRRTQLLAAVAATALLGAGAAVAGDINGPIKPERAPAAQQNAPAAKIAPSMHAGERHGTAETTGQGEAKDSTHALKPSAGGNAELNEHGTVGAAPEKGSTSGSANVDEGSHTKAGVNAQEKNTTSGEASGNDKTSEKNTTQGKTQENAGKSEHNAAKQSAEHKSGSDEKNATTGQGAAASASKLTTKQRSQITTIIKKEKVHETHLNISVRVGVHVPAHVHYYPLPSRVVEIYPEWRGYDYILVSDQILVIDPDSHVVVAILET